MSLRIAHVIPYIGEEASGPAYSVPALAEAVAARGHHVELHTLGAKAEIFQKVKLVQYGPGKTWFGFSSAMRNGLIRCAKEVDIMHNHSLWMMPNVYPAIAQKLSGVQLVTSPRGVFGEWAMNHSRWKKKAMWTLLQQWTVRFSAAMFATSELEYLDIRRLGIRNPVAIIPNGIDLDVDVTADKTPNDEVPVILFVGRVHEKKGLDRLFLAWKIVQNEFPNWSIRIVGPDGGDVPRLQALISEHQLNRIQFDGALYGAEKREAYRRAAIHVLPSHSENFGMSVAEACAMGTPTIASIHTPWSVLKEQQMGDWVDNEPSALASSLRQWMLLAPSERIAAGSKARRWAADSLSWAGIARKSEQTYNWLLKRESRPSFVQLD